MKLSKISGLEPPVKLSLNFKRSTVDLLERYQAQYKATHGTEASLKDISESMLLAFMAEDKSFQKFLKEQARKAPANKKSSASVQP